jgi:hypothetical protein
MKTLKEAGSLLMKEIVLLYINAIP